MRAGVNALIAVCAAAAIHIAPLTSVADEEEQRVQEGENRWVPSFAFTSGIWIQRHSGSMQSRFFDETTPQAGPGVQLRPGDEGFDRVVTPFVGGTLELMAPALPIPTRPRLFVAGEYLPSFPAERQPAQEREPSRIRGPEPNTVLAVEETNTASTNPPRGPRQLPFGETDANGQGARTLTEQGTLTVGAKIGVAFPVEFAGRQLRIKPSFGWIRYKVRAKGVLVDPTCRPVGASTQCTNVYDNNGNLLNRGFLRESILQNSASELFDAFGPGLDIEIDTGRFGPIGSALFFGVGGYYLPGDREISFSDAEAFSDELGNDVHTASWKLRVAPWIYRAGVGMRFQWLGWAR